MQRKQQPAEENKKDLRHAAYHCKFIQKAVIPRFERRR
jgi:hypothetical protein